MSRQDVTRRVRSMVGRASTERTAAGLSTDATDDASTGIDSNGKSRTSVRREVTLGIVFAWLLTLVFFAPLLNGKTFTNVLSAQQVFAPWLGGVKGAYFPQIDLGLFVYPYTVLQTHAWRAGTIPLWNPYNLGGLPLLANGQSGVLYPLRIVLAFLVSPAANHDLFAFVHVFASGVFMFLLMKEFRLRLPAALLGAAGWM